MSTEPEVIRAESWNYNEVHAAIDLMSARAMKRGDYGLVSDLAAIANFVDDLQAKVDAIESLRRPMEVIFHGPFEPPDFVERRLGDDE